VPGRIDAFVAGVGTGGTVSGVGRLLRETYPACISWPWSRPPRRCSPAASAAAPHPGIGAGFVPGVFDRAVVDEIRQVQNADAAEYTRRLAHEEGLLVGISSGAALWAAVEVSRELGEGRTVVVILPDTGERYLSTGLFG